MSQTSISKMYEGSAGSKSGGFSDLLSRQAWIDFFTKTPCVKSSLLWGIGCSSLLFAHKTRLYRGFGQDVKLNYLLIAPSYLGHISHGIHFAVPMFLFTATYSLFWCDRELREKKKLWRETFRRREDRTSNV